MGEIQLRPVQETMIQNVAVLVDVQNIYYTVRQRFNGHFDYNAFFCEVTAGRNVVKATAYATGRGDNRQRHFQDILRTIGFEVKLTPYIRRRDGSSKGDWDVGIALDMVDVAPRTDTVVLASGDGDYAPAVCTVGQKYGVAVDVYGVDGLTAASLIRAASRYVPIEGNLVMPIPESW
jgi:uncharacterized LabA/DUF88 family protein